MAVDVKLNVAKPNVVAEISLNNNNKSVINIKSIRNSYDGRPKWNDLKDMDCMSVEDVLKLIKDLEYLVLLAKGKESKMAELQDDCWLR